MIETGNDREIGNGNDREREWPGTGITGNENDRERESRVVPEFGACLVTWV